MYSNLNTEDITDAGYMHAKKVCYTIKIKNVDEYHDLYLKSDILLLTDVFENFRKMCLKIYHSDPAKFLSAPGLAWQVALKRSKVKLELLTDISMLLMVEKSIWGRICHPTALAQVKAGNTSENLLNKIRQIIYFLYWAKEITKKVYDNIMNSTMIQYKMNTIFMNW